MENKITDNTAKARFELEEEGHIAYADYARSDDGKLTIKYVFAPEALRGRGTAGRLMEGIASIATAENREIVPICGYAASWLRRHAQ